MKENNKILGASSDHDRLSILHGLNTEYADKIRTSINLIKGGIDSADKVCQAVSYLASIGCLHIKINELQDNADLYVSYENIMGTKMHEPYALGCQNEVSIAGFSGVKIILKRSCFKVADRKATWKDLLKALYMRYIHKSNNKFRVVYENGETANTWLKKHD